MEDSVIASNMNKLFPGKYYNIVCIINTLFPDKYRETILIALLIRCFQINIVTMYSLHVLRYGCVVIMDTVIAIVFRCKCKYLSDSIVCTISTSLLYSPTCSHYKVTINITFYFKVTINITFYFKVTINITFYFKVQ